MSLDRGHDQLHIAHLLDVCAPVDDLHLECAAALTIVRAGFAEAHGRVGVEAARFAADCARLTALIDTEGAA